MRVRRGFTIVEMVIVMAIMGMMAAVAVPAFKRWVEEDEMTVATQTIESLFRLARDSAVRSGSNVTVWIDSASSQVWLLSDTDTSTVAPASVVPGRVDLAPGESIELPSTVGMYLTKGRARFAFAPSGAVFGDTLELRTGMQSRIIILNPWTGDVIY
jgi:prepilin-type N-terminal cleavage/methylation domain-containing protein